LVKEYGLTFFECWTKTGAIIDDIFSELTKIIYSSKTNEF